VSPDMKRPVTAAIRRKAERLHEEGQSATAIAKALNLHEATVARWFPNPRDQERADRMRAMIDQGMTLEEVGHHYGISRAGVSQIVGPVGRRKPERGVRRTISLSPGVWNGLRLLAIRYGYMHGGRPSVDAMLDAMAAGDLVAGWRDGQEDIASPPERGKRTSIDLSERRWKALGRIAGGLGLHDATGGDMVRFLDRIGTGRIAIAKVNHHDPGANGHHDADENRIAAGWLAPQQPAKGEGVQR
jgi:hypothetical protein